MRILLLFLGFIISLSCYASVYESQHDGVTEFSNTKLKNAKKLDLASQPVTVIDLGSGSTTQHISSRINPITRPFYLNRQDTMQSSFPEQFTDNYYDFYGTNHHYYSLMSSTIGMSMYSPNDENNMRLQRNY